MLLKRDKKEIDNLIEKIEKRLERSFPSPGEAKRLGWQPLYDPDMEEIIAYLKPNVDIIFKDGTMVVRKSVEVDDNDVEE